MTKRTPKTFALKLIAQGKAHKEVAAELNTAGFQTKDKRPFTSQMIWRLIKPNTGLQKTLTKESTIHAGATIDKALTVEDAVRVVNFCEPLHPKQRQAAIAILLADS